MHVHPVIEPPRAVSAVVARPIPSSLTRLKRCRSDGGLNVYLFGDLGGFSESGGQWHAQLQLGIKTEGSITTSTNCQPDNAGTASVFGAPSSPKISFSISAEGNFDPTDGTITFGKKITSYAYLGGTEYDTVSGKLTGGLQIYFFEKGKAVNVTDDTTDVVVGQPIHLQARLPDGSLPKLTGKGWTGTSEQTALDNYDFYDSFARTYLLDQEDLMKPDLTFYWVKAPEAAIEGSGYSISVTGRNPKTGDEESADTTFDVAAPQVDRFVATTCGVGINRTIAGIRGVTFYPPEISLGANNTAPGCTATPGIQWGIDVTTPSISGGDLAMTQLATETLNHNAATCTVGGYAANGTRTLADVGRAYARVETPVGAGDNWKPNLNDTPGSGLRHGGTWRELDTFSDYIMFKPDIPQSIWVALAQMGPWTWSGSADEGDGEWVLSTHQDPPKSLASAETSVPPEWNGAVPLFPRITGC